MVSFCGVLTFDFKDSFNFDCGVCDSCGRVEKCFELQLYMVYHLKIKMTEYRVVFAYQYSTYRITYAMHSVKHASSNIRNKNVRQFGVAHESTSLNQIQREIISFW